MSYDLTVSLDLEQAITAIEANLDKANNETITDVAEKVVNCTYFHGDRAAVLVELLKRQTSHVQEFFFELWSKHASEETP